MNYVTGETLVESAGKPLKKYFLVASISKPVFSEAYFSLSGASAELIQEKGKKKTAIESCLFHLLVVEACSYDN